MKTELLGQDKNVVKVKVDFDAVEFTDGLRKTLNGLSREMNIPGFRKGHAPRRVIEMRVGRDALYGETLENLLSDAIRQIIEDYELETIDQPSLTKTDEINEGEPLSCELAFEVMPEVKLPVVEEIEVEKVRTKVTDDMVDKLIAQLRKERAAVKPVERPAGDGDILKVTFRTCVMEDGAAETEPRTSNIDLADEQVRPEIRDALKGHSTGDAVETEFTVEEDYRDRSVAGKRIHYAMTVEQVLERELPELGEEFYKKLFGEKTDILTEKAFRDKLRGDLTANMERENSEDAEHRALSEICRRAELELPETLLKRQTVALRQRDEQEARDRYRMELRDVFGAEGENWEKDYASLLNMRAEDIVRRSLVIDAAAKKYNVTVERSDIEAELDQRARQYGVDRNTLMAYLYKTKEAMSQLADEVHYAKVRRHLMSLMKVKDVDELTPPPASDNADKDKKAGS